MLAQFVTIDVAGSKMPTYVAEPAGAARGAVIVFEEIFGVNRDMQKIGDLLADDGYLALVPNLFHRTDPDFDAPHDETGFAKGRAAAGAVTLEQLTADTTAVANYALKHLGPDAKIATWGFCFGGSIAYLSATLPFVTAAVSFYGGQIAQSPAPGRPPMLVATPQIAAPLLLAFGGKDAYIPVADYEAIRTALQENGKAFDLRVYPDEDHGFFRHGPEGTPGARDVWDVVRAFLKAHLG